MNMPAADLVQAAEYAVPTEYGVPVEYAVAVDRYLAGAELGAASRRVYRISLAGWAWPLVGKTAPAGASRRKASPPIVPLALLDDSDAGHRIADALACRRQSAQLRTVSRELSALRSAISWWQHRRWIASDPTADLEQFAARPVAAQPLTDGQLAALFRTPAGLREQAFWHLLVDAHLTADAALRLDAGAVDLTGRRARLPDGRPAEWSGRTCELLGWLLAGRRTGPVFLTDRRAPAGTTAADLCPLSGRGRMSYRRAAEIFTEHTRALDPEGRGWMLHQLRRRG